MKRRANNYKSIIVMYIYEERLKKNIIYSKFCVDEVMCCKDRVILIYEFHSLLDWSTVKYDVINL